MSATRGHGWGSLTLALMPWKCCKWSFKALCLSFVFCFFWKKRLKLNEAWNIRTIDLANWYWCKLPSFIETLLIGLRKTLMHSAKILAGWKCCGALVGFTNLVSNTTRSKCQELPGGEKKIQACLFLLAGVVTSWFPLNQPQSHNTKQMP